MGSVSFMALASETRLIQLRAFWKTDTEGDLWVSVRKGLLQPGSGGRAPLRMRRSCRQGTRAHEGPSQGSDSERVAASILPALLYPRRPKIEEVAWIPQPDPDPPAAPSYVAGGPADTLWRSAAAQTYRRRVWLRPRAAIDRYYIENFLARQATDVTGRVLEIKDASCTWRYGSSRVGASDVPDVAEGDGRATIRADLTRAYRVPSDAYDRIIFTQTLQFIYDVRSAIQTCQRILKPGGGWLATFPDISRTSCRKHDRHHSWHLFHSVDSPTGTTVSVGSLRSMIGEVAV
jgi:hypothetical protein